MVRKAVALISGGLDSVLAAKIVGDQGFEVLGLYCTTTFSKSYGREEDTHAARVAKEIGIELRVLDLGQAYTDLIRNPKHGYGKNVNPCIDCKIFMLRKAKAVMNEIGASFIVTGEVLGQRPMSQRRDTLYVIERDSGLKGIVLRPLSAKLLPPTKAEQEGIVDRDKLCAVSGRSRNRQIELAKNYGITGFSAPAGGCLLTDEHFAAKLRDLFEHELDITQTDVRLLTVGRHFRLASGLKVVLGREESENKKIMALEQPGYHLFMPDGFPGPVALLAGEPAPEDKLAAGRLILKYSKPTPDKPRRIRCNNEIFDPGEPIPGETGNLKRVGMQG